MWKGQASCRFLGGKLGYQKTNICKKGRNHVWKLVRICVKGPVMAKSGFDYKHGRGFRRDRSHRTIVIGGMTLGKCY